MEFTKVEIIGAVGALISVITALWLLLKAYMKRDDARLEKYEQYHELNHKQIVELTGEHRELKGRIEGVENLSKSVLEEIRRMK
tara:strand:- start:765 stop:1016 length:252 start_codon:yes stop_codon:yes gene_type:complete